MKPQSLEQAENDAKAHASIRREMTMTTVYIDSDPTTLGPDATASDLATYGGQ